MASFFCLVWTIALYFAIKPFHRRLPRFWLSPAIVVPALTIALLLAADIPYAAYVADTRWMVWLLGPATIAFAVPIYEHRAIVRRHWLALAIGVVVGTLVALVSARLLAEAFHFSNEVSSSLMARSVSTPFAVAVVSHTGGSADLVSLFTVMTGLVGMMVGDAVLALLRLRSPVAQGASLGAAAHGFGTARARQRHTEEGVVASLTMVLAGVLMVVAGPTLTGWVIAVVG
ncbi:MULTISPECIES: LrgB family protein [unclassified Cupriavidus]|uniref:LrgB family protein n=1 Tax=unclassified Cupriavidus TaxID=2640874 RepID=UPI0010F7207B|nr:MULTISPECIES: LrgB family protein [unclassified Cupriavidus]MWL87411.1 LrgB family protein [Cupriavidus sp. SW-Y-13]